MQVCMPVIREVCLIRAARSDVMHWLTSTSCGGGSVKAAFIRSASSPLIGGVGVSFRECVRRLRLRVYEWGLRKMKGKLNGQIPGTS